VVISRNYSTRSQIHAPQQLDLPDREKRYIFNGDSTPNLAVDRTRSNKKRSYRASTFNIILMLFGYGITIVLYIGNIIAVNRLASEVSLLQTRFERIADTNTVLQAEVDRKSARERIGKLASKMLGLRYPQEQPMQFEIEELELGKDGI
jgi:cell division protein FtsB